jgi:hypothetical protein
MSEDNGSVDAGNPEAEAAPAAAPVAETKASWIEGVSDPDIRAYAETKGFHNTTVDNVVKSYQNLEKIMGADKAGRTVVLPGLDADEQSLGDFYTKLGRPEKADGYDLPVPEGSDGKMATWAKGVFHEAGLSDKQAKMVAEKWNEYVGGAASDSVEQNRAASQEAESTLKKEWGAAFDQKVAGIDRAAKQLGMSDDQLTGLRNSMGPVAAMKFVDNLASKLGEAPMDNDNINPTGGMRTPAAARVELSQLGLDKDFMVAWLDKGHPAHRAAVEKKQNLSKMASGIAG